MFCPNCGKPIPEDSVFCPECGSPLENEHPRSSSKKKEGKGPLIAVIVLAIFLLIGVVVAGVLVLNKTSGNVAEVTETDTAAGNEEDLDESTEDIKNEEKEDDFDGFDGNESTSSSNSTAASGSTEKSQESETVEAEERVLTPADISVEVNDVQPTDLGLYTQLSVASTNSSSTVAQAGYDNSSSQVIDGREETSWQEGVDGDGIGQTLTLNFAQSQKVKYIGLKLGNWRDNGYYLQNNIPAALSIGMGAFSTSANFSSDKVIHWIKLSDEWETSSLTLTINDVYRGSEWQDTCIAEVMIYGE